MHDKLLELAADDDIGAIGSTGSYTSSKSIKLSEALADFRDIGMGTGLCVDVNVTEQFVGSGLLTIYAVLSPTEPGSLTTVVPNQVYVGANGPHKAADLVRVDTTGLEKATTIQVAISPYNPITRSTLLNPVGLPYLNLVYLIESATFSEGKVSARLGLAGRSPALHYPATTGGIT
jgi:hypothetical protein